MSEINEFILINTNCNDRVLVNVGILDILNENLNHYKFSN